MKNFTKVFASTIIAAIISNHSYSFDFAKGLGTIKDLHDKHGEKVKQLYNEHKDKADQFKHYFHK
jgi:hypothetical protein